MREMGGEGGGGFTHCEMKGKARSWLCVLERKIKLTHVQINLCHIILVVPPLKAVSLLHKES